MTIELVEAVHGVNVDLSSLFSIFFFFRIL